MFIFAGKAFQAGSCMFLDIHEAENYIKCLKNIISKLRKKKVKIYNHVKCCLVPDARDFYLFNMSLFLR